MFFICLIGYHIFLPLYQSEHIIIDYGIHPFDICIEQPIIWKYCKYWFIFTYIFTSFFISNMLFHLLFKKNHKCRSKPKSETLDIKNKNKLKSKPSYSLIDPKPPDKKLQLLIR